MAGDVPDSAASSDSPLRNHRLDSWKEIAAYLKRDITTVRRWEKREGLPVHRHLHERRDSVYAYADEVDSWQHARQRLPDNGGDHSAAGETDAAAPQAIAEVPRIENRAALAWALASVFFVTTAVLAGALFVTGPGRARDQHVERRFPLLPPPGTRLGDVSLSPDGRSVAFTAVPDPQAGGKPLLWVRSLDSLDARALTDTEDAAFAALVL